MAKADNAVLVFEEADSFLQKLVQHYLLLPYQMPVSYTHLRLLLFDLQSLLFHKEDMELLLLIHLLLQLYLLDQ